MKVAVQKMNQKISGR